MFAMWPDLLLAGAFHVPSSPTLLLFQPQQRFLGYPRGGNQTEEEDQRGTRQYHVCSQVIDEEQYV